MISTNSKLALALGVMGAIALSAPSAEARTKRSAPKAQSNSSQVVQPSYTNRSSYGYQVPSGGYDRYNLPPGGGINFNDGRLGANYSGGG